MSSIAQSSGPGSILRRSICAGLAVAMTGLAFHGVVGFAAASYEAASSLTPAVARASIGGAARGLVRRAGRTAASSIRVVLAR